MNWRDKSLRPAAWLPVFLSLAACQTLTDIDTSVGPDANRIGVNYVEVSMPTELVQVDSFITSNTGRLLTGRLVDSELGTITATAYNRLRLATPDPVIKTDSRFDSLVLYWEVSYVASPQAITNNQQFDIYHLAEDEVLEENTFYYAQEELSLGNQIGSGVLDIDREPDDSVYSIRLDDAWGEELLQGMLSRAPEFKNNTQFIREYPGLAFVSDPNNQAIVGIRNSAGSETRLTLFFSSPGDSISKEYEFDMNGNGSPSYHLIETANNGTATMGISGAYQPVDGDGRVITTSGARYGTLLDLSVLKAYFDTLSPNLINYAELSLSDIENLDRSNTPLAIRFYLTDEDGRFVPVLEPDSAISLSNPPKGIYDYTANQEPTRLSEIVYFEPRLNDSTDNISGPITPFLQSLAEGTIVEPKLLLLPVGFGASVRTLKLDESDLRVRFYLTKPN